MDKQLKRILKKLCKMVSLDYSKVNFKSESWYYQAEWTEEQERKFVKWLTKKLYWNEKMYKSISDFPFNRCSFFQKIKGHKGRRKHAKDLASFFNCMYGWGVKS